MEMLNALAGLNMDKSPETGRIFLRFLHETRETVAGALAGIFKSVLHTNEVPDD